MAGLIADAAFPGLRAALELLLVHTCTVTPVVAGSADSENTPTVADGTPQAGVPCAYSTEEASIVDEGGRTITYRSTLMAAATGPIRSGVKVTAITDQLGAVLAAGPFLVARATDQTAGLGAPLLPTYGLTGAGAS